MHAFPPGRAPHAYTTHERSPASTYTHAPNTNNPPYTHTDTHTHTHATHVWQVIPALGHIHVMSADGKSLPACYVKVFSRKKGGDVAFYKVRERVCIHLLFGGGKGSIQAVSLDY